jgi:hypothetical protein
LGALETRSFVTYMVGVSPTPNLCGESLKNVIDNGTATTPKKSLEDRITALEERVMLLESGGMSIDFDDVSSLSQVDLYGEYGDTVQPPKPEPTRMGAPQKMTDGDFELRRDDYVRWVEGLWPEFDEVTSSPGGDGELREKLLRRFPARDGDRLFQMLLVNVFGLHDYLTSKSNTGEPRQMAYVLAGLSGGLTWKYSLERGRKNPSKERVQFRAMREHIERRHPAWYRDLTTESSQAKAIAKIPPGCLECKRFRSRPERIIPALQVRPLSRSLTEQYEPRIRLRNSPMPTRPETMVEPMPLSLPDYVTRWKASILTERAAAQSHFIDLCEVLDSRTPLLLTRPERALPLRNMSRSSKAARATHQQRLSVHSDESLAPG